MKFNKLATLALGALLAFNISCRDDDYFPIETQPVQKGPYEGGILVANEGNFGSPTASVSFISKDGATVTNDIFKTNNNGAILGDVLQDIGLKNDRAYLVVNNSDKVEVVNRYTFKSEKTITEQISKPRYVTFANDNVYISNNKAVNIYKESDLTLVKKIDFGTAERLVTVSNVVFVQNASFGSGKTISVINSANSIDKVLTVPKGNINKIVGDGQNVYAITRNGSDSYIYQYDSTGSLLKTIDLTGISGAGNLEINDSKMYFTAGTNVYAMDVKASSAPAKPLFSLADAGFFTFYGFNVVKGKIYVSDPKGFTADSEVSVYDAGTGTKISTFTTARGANGFFQN